MIRLIKGLLAYLPAFLVQCCFPSLHLCILNEIEVAGHQAHEAWLKDKLARQKWGLGIAERKALRADTVCQMCQALKQRLEQATDQDRRFVLECLAMLWGVNVVVLTRRC